MKSNHGLLALACVFIVLLAACNKDNDFTALPEIESNSFKNFANVSSSLWDFFERFETEAAVRGISIDLNAQQISAEISQINDTGVAGTCSYGSNTPGHIVIDESFWGQASDRLKEMIIFHELGHCSLFRGHTEDSHPDGSCTSIMRSGLGSCIDNYQSSTRAQYLDELFISP